MACNLGKRVKTEDGYNMEDLISELPNEIVVSIVSLLPLEEAGATSILSRSWKNVWKYTSNLNFDPARFLVANPGLKAKDYPIRKRYVDRVNQVIGLHRGQSIQRFRANFPLNCRFARDIDQWIQFAMKNGVQILELDLHDPFCDNDDEVYTIKKKLFCLGKGFGVEPLSSGTLSRGSRGLDTGFNSLKVLHLQGLGVTGEVLEYLLSKCPVIERLSLINVMKLINIRAVGPPSIALKHLVITKCKELKSVEIRDTNIVSLSYHGDAMIEMHINDVPLLSEVTMLFNYHPRPDSIMRAFAILSHCLSSIETLRLDTSQVVYKENDVFPLMDNLKHLQLILSRNRYSPDSIQHISSFLNASPNLQRLILKYDYPYVRTVRGENEWEVKECAHQNLKVVEMVGYRGDPLVEKHAKYLIENLVSLEKFIIDPSSWSITRCNPPREHLKRQRKSQQVKAREHARRHIGALLPSTVKLVCL